MEEEDVEIKKGEIFEQRKKIRHVNSIEETEKYKELFSEDLKIDAFEIHKEEYIVNIPSKEGYTDQKRKKLSRFLDELDRYAVSYVGSLKK